MNSFLATYLIPGNKAEEMSIEFVVIERKWTTENSKGREYQAKKYDFDWGQ